ncbi:50S ribosomal protein L18 [Candidatus Gottesmanbacteria bacterium]|nr:50S ribosomal protein L18 [Candidatus Gottesmanbacteria bacterium]
MDTKLRLKHKRQLRIRAKISGTSDRPRLAVHRSERTLTIQVIDDIKGVTLVSKSVKATNQTAAKTLGSEIAQLCKKKGITRVVFDRGGNRYHGVIQVLADAAREGGLTI